jgi:hypothetical protein
MVMMMEVIAMMATDGLPDARRPRFFSAPVPLFF